MEGRVSWKTPCLADWLAGWPDLSEDGAVSPDTDYTDYLCLVKEDLLRSNPRKQLQEVFERCIVVESGGN